MMVDLLVWGARLVLHVALAMGGAVIWAHRPRVPFSLRAWRREVLYLVGWVGYLVYGMIVRDQLQVDRVVPAICYALMVLALIDRQE